MTDTPTPTAPGAMEMSEARLAQIQRIAKQSTRAVTVECVAELDRCVDDLLAECATLRAQVQAGREAALEDAAQVCRQEMSRARNLAAAANFENPALAAQAHIVTISREDSASRILEAIRALAQPAKTEGS